MPKVKLSSPKKILLEFQTTEQMAREIHNLRLQVKNRAFDFQRVLKSARSESSDRLKALRTIKVQSTHTHCLYTRNVCHLCKIDEILKEALKKETV